ncbi:delta(8)-fatty-acid desaturase 2-like [Senna tora]|uniref:Delta(8)-fatty-acid desaturase 2-like n=1 Tax=Senna tora TaxID=362788 RepID=A0A834T4K2_9FABA|nr:delta(8)-fatty-acid desaturase 2-like [Senna tora]
MGSAVLLGLLWMQSSYMGHDSGHYQVMKNRNFNQFAQILCGNCLTGISIVWWKWTHNAHHLSCNNLDHDPDLQHMPVFRRLPCFLQLHHLLLLRKKAEFQPNFSIPHKPPTSDILPCDVFRENQPLCPDNSSSRLLESKVSDRASFVSEDSEVPTEEDCSDGEGVL